MSNYRNKLRAPLPAIHIRGHRTAPGTRPGPSPVLDGLTVRPTKGQYFEADYFAPPPENKETPDAAE